MSCLAEERLIELLDEGGLQRTRPDERAHLESCESCRESWGAVAAAAELLSEARPRASGRAARWIPLAAAAAMLLAILAVIAQKKTPGPIKEASKDPVTLFIEGTPDEMRRAYEVLLKQGRPALLSLAAARPRLKGSAREKLFLDLLWAVKLGAVRQDADSKKILDGLEAVKIDLSFENTRIVDVLGFIRDFSKLDVVLDPSLDAGIVEKYRVQDQNLRYALEILCAVKDLEFDVKYGVLFISTPMRIWSTDPGVGLPNANEWTRRKPTAPNPELESKVESTRLTVDMQNAPLSSISGYISEITGLKMKLEEIPDEPLSLAVQDLSLKHVLELLSLPYGRDVRFDNGSIVLFIPKK
jgi:hypothetical protein